MVMQRMGSILPLKPRKDITTSPKQGTNGSTKKDYSPSKFKRIEEEDGKKTLKLKIDPNVMVIVFFVASLHLEPRPFL